MGNLDKLIKDNYFDTNFAIKRFKIDPKRKSWFINNQNSKMLYIDDFY